MVDMARSQLPSMIRDDILRNKYGGRYAKHINFIVVNGRRFTCKLCNNTYSIMKLKRHIAYHWYTVYSILASNKLVKQGGRRRDGS